MKAAAREEINGIGGRVVVDGIINWVASEGGVSLDDLICTNEKRVKTEDACEFSIVRRMIRMICTAVEVRSSSVLLALPISKPLGYKLNGFMSMGQRDSNQEVATAPLEGEDG